MKLLFKKDKPVKSENLYGQTPAEIAARAIREDDKAFFAQWIEENYYSDPEVAHAAADALYEQTQSDGGAWALGLLKSVKKTNCSGEVLLFIHSEFFDKYGSVTAFPEVRIPIADAAVEVAEALCRRDGTQTNRQLLSLWYTITAEMRVFADDPALLPKAEADGKRALKINEKLADESGTSQSRAELAWAFNVLGLIYKYMATESSLQKALQYYTRGLEIEEPLAAEPEPEVSQSRIADHLTDIGNVLKALGGKENSDRAASYFNRAVGIYEGLAQEQECDMLLQSLAYCYSCAGELYYYNEMEEADALTRAEELYTKALAVRENLVKMLSTDKACIDLAEVCFKLTRVYHDQGGKEAMQRSYEACERTRAAIEPPETEQIDAALLQRIDMLHWLMGDFCKELGEESDLRRAAEHYTRHVGYAGRLARELGTEEAQKILMNGCIGAGMVYNRLGTREDYERSAAFYGQALEICESLSAAGSSVLEPGNILSCRDGLATALKMLGSPEDLERSIALYTENVKACEEAAEEQGTLDAFHNLARALYNVSSNPALDPALKKEYLTNGIKVVKMLIEKTGDEVYQMMLDRFTGKLEEMD